MNKFIHIIKFILLFIWQLPQNIIALLMFPFMGKARLIKYNNYCLAFERKRMNGAIALGNFIFLSPYAAKRETTIAHEYGHIIDSHKTGWFYLPVIGFFSLCWAILKPKNKCYYSFFTERRANKNAGLGVDSLCRLYFIDKPDYKKNK